jgi:hypothetical protein
MYKPVLKDVEPLYVGVSHWYVKTWGMMGGKNQERSGYVRGFKDGWIKGLF